jgi:predicted ATPase
MIKAVEFKNFKVLRNAKLTLGRFTLLVGPNGSGKSTVFQALRWLADPSSSPADRVLSVGLGDGDQRVSVSAVVELGGREFSGSMSWQPHRGEYHGADEMRLFLGGLRTYSLDARRVAEPVTMQPYQELTAEGGNLAGVLERLRDEEPERFETLNSELAKWLHEFDRIVFDTPGQGQKAFALRTRKGHHRIRAADLSQGTLLALVIMTVAFLPKPPAVVCLEEPDHGIHPRLLRDVKDALYRLTYPEGHGEKRSPMQVIATTHSPYMLDLFRDHLEDIVIANKGPDGVTFERLADRPDVDQIIGECSLGDAWYTGILGGVPAEK